MSRNQLREDRQDTFQKPGVSAYSRFDNDGLRRGQVNKDEVWMLCESASPPSADNSGTTARLAGLDFDRLTEAQVVEHIVTAIRRGRGGWVSTPNIDHCRLIRRDEAMRRLVANASLIVPDGMPLVWASRLRGSPLPERVTGASLIFTLTEAAARHGCSIYLLGGPPGVPQRAGEELCRYYPDLKVAGTDAPPVGFDTDPQAVAAVYDRLAAAAPGIVYVGLGFPKQERLITSFAPSLPATWFIGCGAAIPFAAKALPRAPRWMQHAGLEWTFRLISEPRRLFKRYLIQDLPFAARLLATSAAGRLRHGTGDARGMKDLEDANRRLQTEDDYGELSKITDTGWGL
jgi:N-acetylglucosaminyldiphosphoundecaprenol N-acetyl-beta-D-mannosaminyltransferase